MASSSAATFPSSPSLGLCPGYRHVEQFGPDEEYEDEVEDFYVTLDLGAVEPTLIPSSSTYRLIVSHSNSERRQVKTQFFLAGIRYTDTIHATVGYSAARTTRILARDGATFR